jgi:hypothetical protein
VLAWLSAHQAAFTLVFSALVTLSTVVYAVLTAILVMETRRLRKGQSQPHVSVRIESSPGAFGFTDLVVENVGQGSAYDVRFSLEHDLQLEPRRKASDIGFLRHGVSYLAPRQRLSSYFFQLIGLNDKVAGPDRPRLALTVAYRDAAKNDFTERFELDFAHFDNMMRLGTPPADSIANSLEKIKGAIEHIESGWSKIKVLQYDREDRALEAQEREMRRLNSDPRMGLVADPPSPPEGGAT